MRSVKAENVSPITGLSRRRQVNIEYGKGFIVTARKRGGLFDGQGRGNESTYALDEENERDYKEPTGQHGFHGNFHLAAPVRSGHV